MADTYSQINIHAIFAVRDRYSFITDKYADEFYKYISGILKNMDQYPLAIGGYKDHIHIFFELSPSKSLSDVINVVKTNSSKWINEKKFIKYHFEWQLGYGAFSYSKSQRDNVIQYIMNHKEKHKNKSFKEEYLKILNDFGIKYNEKYLFNFEMDK